MWIHYIGSLAINTVRIVDGYHENSLWDYCMACASIHPQSTNQGVGWKTQAHPSPSRKAVRGHRCYYIHVYEVQERIVQGNWGRPVLWRIHGRCETSSRTDCRRFGCGSWGLPIVQDFQKQQHIHRDLRITYRKGSSHLFLPEVWNLTGLQSTT